jgi:hypothetical protein
MSVKIKLDTTKLNQLIATAPKKTDQIIRTAAFMIEAEAKKNIRAWPLIDTGALLNSIAVERIKTGQYEVGDFGGYTKGKRKSRYDWHDVSAGMEYAVYWELGHHNLFTRHYMRMPFLGPAVVSVTDEIVQMFVQGDIFK